VRHAFQIGASCCAELLRYEYIMLHARLNTHFRLTA
jgi:hypothetical protein